MDALVMPETARKRKEPTQAQKELASEVSQEFRQLWGLRGVWESHWQEIAELVFPMHEWSFNAFQVRTSGQKRTEHIYDSTAPLALQRGGAIMSSLLTPQNLRWHRVFSPDPIVQRDRLSRIWFEKVTDLLFEFRQSPESNFESQNQQQFLSTMAFGTGVMFVDRLFRKPGIRYRNLGLGEVYIRQNHQGMVDSVYRYFRLTAHQAVQKWSSENAYRGEEVFDVPQSIADAAETAPDKEFWFLHVCRPREDRDPQRKDYKGMPWASYYVHVDTLSLLSEGGYRTFPYQVARYYQLGDEVYGRCPAMDVLPDIKTLNEHMRTMLKQAHRQTDPVLLIHDDGALSNISLMPGAVNTGGVSPDGRPLVHTLPIGNWQVGKELMEGLRGSIKAAFLNDIIQILEQDRPEMTATEVLERAKEKGQILVPVLGRQRTEYLDPLIHRELSLLAEQGLLPPPPPLIVQSQAEYATEYESDLSRSQRAQEAAGFQRIVGEVSQFAQTAQKPELLDLFDFDTALRESADIMGVPEHWMASEEDIAQIREQRAQQAQEMASAQAAPGAAALMGAHAKLAAAGVVPSPHGGGSTSGGAPGAG